ncbi:MAG: zinc ABC transporter solute-binding protein [Chloroflexi bacterium]|nr:zinc ABC transporter solute-binding protein [Chloroflexota bacterium]
MNTGMRTFLMVILLVASTVVQTGCNPQPQGAQSPSPSGAVVPAHPLQVTVSILPQQYFVERIAGDLVTVNVMVLPGENPATYEPKPEQLRMLADSAAYFSIGVPFEDAWMERIASVSSRMLIVDTAQGIERKPLAETEQEIDDAQGSEDDHHNHAEGLDPHIWLSPRLVKIQAHTIFEALAGLDPQHETVYRTNLEAFLSDIDRLEEDIRASLRGVRNRKFIVFHPSWGYFANDFGLEQVAIEVGGQEPSAAELASLIEFAKREGIDVILAQPQFSRRSAETIAREIGGEVLLIDPLALDWLDNLSQVARAMAAVLQ